MMFKLSVITDEISQDFEQAVKLAKRYGLPAVELRSVWDKSAHLLDSREINEVKRVCDAYGLTVCALSSMFFKCPMDEAEIPGQLAMLERLITTAGVLDCRLIRGFSFWREEGPAASMADVAAYFAEPARMLGQAGMCLVLEPDPSVNACNGEMLAALVRAIDNPAVRVLWDPGNGLFSPLPEQPYPQGYALVRPYVAHVHIKDAVCVNGSAEAVRVGDGAVDWRGQFRALIEDGYDGYTSLETHYRKNTAITEEQMRMPSGSDFSAGGYAASEECLQALVGMLDSL